MSGIKPFLYFVPLMRLQVLATHRFSSHPTDIMTHLGGPGYLPILVREDDGNPVSQGIISPDLSPPAVYNTTL
jgi:hypothetical protein